MNYDLAKELKDAGFPQRPFHRQTVVYRGPTDTEGRLAALLDDFSNVDEWVVAPTLEELIEACGKTYKQDAKQLEFSLSWGGDEWCANYLDPNYHEYSAALDSQYDHTPTESVARLWLALNAKDNGTIKASS